MSYCTNCGAAVKKGAKFCTSCGSPIKEVEQIQKVDTGLTDSVEDSSKTSSKGIKIIIGLFAVLTLFFITRSLVTNIDISRNSMSISKELNKIVGEWHEPSGIFLGDQEVIIKFRTRGDVVVGEDLERRVYIQLLPISANHYNGLVVLDGKDDDFLVDYYSGENKLVFFSTLTKTGWHLIKK